MFPGKGFFRIGNLSLFPTDVFANGEKMEPGKPRRNYWKTAWMELFDKIKGRIEKGDSEKIEKKMNILKKKCPEYGGEMTPKLINLLYKQNECDIRIDVIGIPANVCNKCFYRIVPGKIAKY